ncbi:MAG TPA: ATP-binding protein [Candidatus Binatia bacterium]|jgi:signal transduction histidine kinase/ActR/RegA family two-component response regulator|nr:ATP-binding protein [Candidatus Binatia bacterium]
MTSFSSLRARLVGTVFLAVAPAWVVMYFIAKKTDAEFPWTAFIVGLLALGAAWFGGERFILRQVRMLYKAARQLAAGDLTSRTGLAHETGELGDLARTFDAMAVSLEQRVREREQAEKTLLTRSFQQIVVSALGQFALVSNNFSALLNQAVMLVAQTLEVEYCNIMELQPGGRSLLLRAGVGWKPGNVGVATVPADATTQTGYTLTAGEPVVVDNLAEETRFHGSHLLMDHGVVSGITVAVSGQGQAFGVLGAHTTHRRQFTEDEVHFLLAVATVVAMAAARKRAEAEMEKLAAFAQLNPNPAMELTEGGRLTYANDAAVQLAASVGQPSPRAILPPNIGTLVQTCLAQPPTKLNLQTQAQGRTLSWSFHPVPASRVVHAYVDDITDRLSLEAQLRQSQKMESVGQLAAGVAHDFNNMLTIIQGHAGMLLAKSAQKSDLLDSAQAIYFAAERAANLTRQLLMFSRKNVMQPKPLDLGEVVSHMSKMLQRLLGETVTLEFQPPAEIPLVQGDIGMVEQVIMNLAVNARDAMPKGGQLSISANPARIDLAYVQTHPEARPGGFVCLQVTDTGCGMETQTMARIFEPFFTTKEVGKGTGLGLATVYGIVKQHEGWIEVASEVGKGTTFSVFFPASTELVEAKPPEAAPAAEVRGGKETILIVEDEPVLRDMAHLILQECGYNILEAGSGPEALNLWDRHRETIDLVLTDMVMPEGVSGMELAQRLLATKPQLRVVFASGYSMDEIDPAFVNNGRAAFLQKPYTHVTLAKAVRECLDK